MGVRPDVTPENVAAELAADARLAERLRDVMARHGGEEHLVTEAERLRRSTRSEGEAGRALCQRLPEGLRRRMATLIGLEAPMLDSLDGQVDFWGAVWMGSQVAEGVLEAALGAPARQVSGVLLEALAGSGPSRQVLEAWLAGQPGTLGALQVIQRAFREAHARRRPEVVAALGPDGAAYVASGGPESSLEQIRGLKGRAEGGTRPVSRVEYVDLLKWLVGARSLSLWDRQGPRPSPPRPDVALLHHYLRVGRVTA